MKLLLFEMLDTDVRELQIINHRNVETNHNMRLVF